MEIKWENVLSLVFQTTCWFKEVRHCERLESVN